MSISFISPDINNTFLPCFWKSATQSNNTVDLPTPGSPIITVLVPGNNPPSVLNTESTIVFVLIGMNKSSLNCTSFIFTNFIFTSKLALTCVALLGLPLLAITLIFWFFNYFFILLKYTKEKSILQIFFILFFFIFLIIFLITIVTIQTNFQFSKLFFRFLFLKKNLEKQKKKRIL